MKAMLLLLSILLGLAALPVRANEASVRDFMDAWIDEAAGDADPGETELALGFYDLDGDGEEEAVALLSGPYWCGSGGCDALVLRRNGGSYDVLMEASVSRAPIGVLGASTNGFRDLYIHVGGGGLPFGAVAMRFDGRRYPDNPTVDGVALPEGFKGKELIGAED